ncbi:anti-sigma-D factor RsdA [Pseudonocardia sp. H11422]|uniref:anti-sigma-D factor RsdA n=1 Tax=Pseudonocardia sp. H11422 TaxID=2835866 RepID=UPI001BDD8804|nr:hypothetical protein [Pseudonocardia sp. H11422]
MRELWRDGGDGDGRQPDGRATDDPIDLVALRADDEWLDALSAGGTQVPADSPDPDDQLAAMLTAWIAGTRATAPQPMAPQVPEPVVVARPARTPVRRAGPAVYGFRFAVAAAVAVFALSGLAIGAREAQPGDTLWSVSKVFHSERARSVEAADDVQTRLVKARTALSAGRAEDAAREMIDVETRLATVRRAEGQDELARQRVLLAAELAATLSPERSRGAAVPADRPGSTPLSPAPGADVVAAPGSPTSTAAPPSGTAPTSTTTSSATSTSPAGESAPPSENPADRDTTEGTPDHGDAPSDQPSDPTGPRAEPDPGDRPDPETESPGSPPSSEPAPEQEDPVGQPDGSASPADSTPSDAEPAVESALPTRTPPTTGGTVGRGTEAGGPTREAGTDESSTGPDADSPGNSNDSSPNDNNRSADSDSADSDGTGDGETRT